MKTTVKFQTTKKPSIEDVLKITKGGRFFSATWRKDGGELRTGIFRTGVKKGTTGKGLSFNPIKKGLLPVYDTRAGFRFIRVEKLISLTANKITYKYFQQDPWADGGEMDQRINNINQLTKLINR